MYQYHIYSLQCLVPISFFPELSKTPVPLVIHKLDNDSICGLLKNAQKTYSVRFGRLLNEFDLHHLYVREKANKDLLQSITAGKRKCGDRSQRLLPSIFSDIDPVTRDELLQIFEQRMRKR